MKNVYLNWALNSLSVALFLGLVSWLHPNDQWYTHIALPIVVLSTFLLEIILIFVIRLKNGLLINTAIIMAAIAILSVAIEMVLDLHFKNAVSLGWSAIVLTCCLVIDIILLTIYRQEGLRAEIRRRMHF